jgi:hypothetical protein
MARDDQRLHRYLNEALAMERALVSTLSAHLAMTPSGPYRRLLQRHLTETRAHAAALQTHAASTSPINLTLGLAETVVGQAVTLAKVPLELIRGGEDPRERLLKNAKDEAATEATTRSRRSRPPSATPRPRCSPPVTARTRSACSPTCAS